MKASKCKYTKPNDITIPLCSFHMLRISTSKRVKRNVKTWQLSIEIKGNRRTCRRCATVSKWSAIHVSHCARCAVKISQIQIENKKKQKIESERDSNCVSPIYLVSPLVLMPLFARCSISFLPRQNEHEPVRTHSHTQSNIHIFQMAKELKLIEKSNEII